LLYQVFDFSKSNLQDKDTSFSHQKSKTLTVKPLWYTAETLHITQPIPSQTA